MVYKDRPVGPLRETLKYHHTTLRTDEYYGTCSQLRAIFRGRHLRSDLISAASFWVWTRVQVYLGPMVGTGASSVRLGPWRWS